jgi:2-hydroxychromene-2-carboxylate isomerase
MAERLRRRVIPSAIIALSTIDRPARAAAALQRARGHRQRVELFFAFDDPCSAVAVIDVAQRLAGRPVDLVPVPVVERGIPGDPAVAAKRRYAIEDARRLGRRSGLVLAREEPLDPERTAFLAQWVAGAPENPALLDFSVEALRALWFETSGPVMAEDYAPIWRRAVRTVPELDPRAVERNQRRMLRRGPYDTPAAAIGRQWYFAHDRAAQIADRLDRLGWTAAA